MIGWREEYIYLVIYDVQIDLNNFLKIVKEQLYVVVRQYLLGDVFLLGGGVSIFCYLVFEFIWCCVRKGIFQGSYEYFFFCKLLFFVLFFIYILYLVLRKYWWFGVLVVFS